MSSSQLPLPLCVSTTPEWPNVGSMLGRRRRRRPNIKPTLDKRLRTEPDRVGRLGDYNESVKDSVTH